MQSINGSPWGKAKVRPTYGWILPDSRPKRTNCGFSAGLRTPVKYFKLYCKYSSLAGFKYICEDETTWIERVLWLILYGLTLPTLIFMVRSGYHEFFVAPVSTNVDPNYFPTSQLDLPALSICSVNRISNASAVRLATKAYESTGSNLTLDEIYDLILELGSLYDSSFVVGPRLKETDRLLTELYKGHYDITDIMRELSPGCSDVLLICVFRGHKRNCSDLFETRKTQDGFCCTFNYVAAPDDIPTVKKGPNSGGKSKRAAYKAEKLGIGHGLTIVMDPWTNDTAYPLLPIPGLKATIFNSWDYPDATSGGVTEVVLSPRTERYIELDALSFYTTSTVRSYPVGVRKCIFSDEIKEAHHETYTYSDCLVDCKLKNILARCNCRPFNFPRRGEEENSQKVCNTLDVPCLTKHKSKWIRVYPYNSKAFSDTHNDSGTLHCESCYPSCVDVTYTMKTFVSYMEPGIYNTNLLPGINVVDQCVLHLYFTKIGTVRLKQDVVYQWYELLSEIGSICGVFVGFSLISVIELLYFAVLFILELCDVSSATTAEANVKSKADPISTIYWSELYPRSKNFNAFE